jgi:hypothetical protein
MLSMLKPGDKGERIFVEFSTIRGECSKKIYGGREGGAGGIRLQVIIVSGLNTSHVNRIAVYLAPYWTWTRCVTEFFE